VLVLGAGDRDVYDRLTIGRGLNVVGAGGG
jgi:hypothetical protein